MSNSGVDLQYPDSLNIAARLAAGALDAGWGERTAFFYRDQEISYAQTADAAARWAGALHTRGVQPEERVLLALPDAPPFVSTFLGAIHNGSVAVPVNPYLPGDRYEFFLADSRAVAAVVAPWLVGPILEAAARLPRLRHLLVFDDPGAADGGVGDGGWRDASVPSGRPALHDGNELLAASNPVAATTTHCDEPAFWLYTSGSTGSPKGAIHLQHDIWVAAECWSRGTMKMTTEHVHLSASKLYFAYGLGNSLHCPMWSGGSTVLVPEKPTPALMLDAIAARRVTHFYAVPSFYNAMMAEDGFDDRVAAGELESLHVCVSAGEVLPAPLCTAWTDQTGAPLIDGIGSTELLHIFIANRVDDIRPGCSGTPIPGYAARVVSEDGTDAPDDVVGDLWIRGDSSCAAYWNRHDATKSAIQGEWFVTGDKYRRDAAGYYWYAGRADDMFKVHGQWVSPTQVEGVLLVHRAVREAAVVSGTDSEGLARGVAFVVAAVGPAEEALAAELIKHTASQMPRYAVPGEIRFRDELPRTATGKIQRYRLRQES